MSSKFAALRDKYATTGDARKWVPKRFRHLEQAKQPYVLIAPYGISNKLWSSVHDSVVSTDEKIKMDAGEVGNERLREITRETFLGACVRGWGNIPTAEEQVAFSVDEARELFGSPDMSDFYLEALDFSRESNNYLLSRADDVAKK